MTLAELITSDPANATKTDQQILDWLNESVNIFVDISWLDFSMWMAKHNLRPTILTAASNGTNAEKTAAQHMLDCIASGNPLYASDSRVRTVIQTAMPSGTARDELVAMATETKTRWELAGQDTSEDTPSRLKKIEDTHNG